LPVIAHVCALEDACMVPELAALVLSKLQPAVSVPEPAAASDSRASASRTRMLRAAVAAAATTFGSRASVASTRVETCTKHCSYQRRASSDGKENSGRSQREGNNSGRDDGNCGGCSTALCATGAPCWRRRRLRLTQSSLCAERAAGREGGGKDTKEMPLKEKDEMRAAGK
jgi:hypothetical protein